MAGALGKLVHLTSLNLGCTWHGGVVCVCVACVYAGRAVSECAWEVVAVWGCVTDAEGLGWAWVTGNGLRVGGASALAGPLGKLVHLTSLNLSSAWRGGALGVCRVYACRAVSECAWEVVAV